MLHIVESSGSAMENKAGDGGGGFWMGEWRSLQQTCGFLWSPLAGVGQRSTKWSVSVLQSPKDTHKHRGRSNVLSENVAYPALDQMELSG